MIPSNTITPPRRRARAAVLVAAVAALALLSGCGPKKETATQTAAKVNKDEITVHQINYVLQQQRAIRPEQVDAVGRQVLERLIDQQLALQKAEDLKVDRDPRVLQQLEATRREVLTRAYYDKIGEAVPRPTPEEVKKYYDEKPALFGQRRIYNLQEIAIEARPEQLEPLRSRLAQSKRVGDFVDYLKSNDFRFTANQAVRAAEQLPMSSLEGFAAMKDGQAAALPTPTGLQVVVLAGSRPAPVTEEQARPAIEQFILNDRRRKLLEDDRKALRAAATVSYVGKFAETAASSAASSASEAVAAPPGAASEAAFSASEVSKGLGIK